jgi:hypothetical protein
MEEGNQKLQKEIIPLFEEQMEKTDEDKNVEPMQMSKVD